MERRGPWRRGRWLVGTSLAVAMLVILAAHTDTASAKKPPPPPPPADADPAIAHRAYTGKGKKASCKLFVMDEDGSNETAIYDAGSGWISGVDWSPDGDQLVMTLAIPEGRGIYLIDADGSNLTKIADTVGIPGPPVWSRCAVPGIGNDVECIAWHSQKATERAKVYVLPLDGSDPVQLPTPAGLDANEIEPTWSASGTRLAFTLRVYPTVPPGTWGLYDFEEDTYTVGTVSGSLGGVSIDDAYVCTPAWSRTNESEIAWSLKVPGDMYYDIWVLGMDGQPVRQVTNTSDIHEEYQSWSPDDARLVVRSIDMSGGGQTAYETFSATDGSGRAVIVEDVSYEPEWRQNED